MQQPDFLAGGVNLDIQPAAVSGLVGPIGDSRCSLVSVSAAPCSPGNPTSALSLLVHGARCAKGGNKAIRDEAQFHGEDLAKPFSKLADFHERAMWTLLERPKYWSGAVYFHPPRPNCRTRPRA